MPVLQHPPYGLLGEHLTHSFSPQIHKLLGSYEYKLFPTAKSELDAFLKSQKFSGLNVTIPYKESVIPYCSSLSETASRIGSVNTITISREHKLIGDNTDYFGFCYLLSQLPVSYKGKKAIILGSGGSSKTVHTALEDAGCSKIIVISRTGENNYTNLSQHRDAAILVNTTPVGMYPNNGKSPVDLALFPVLEGVIDIIFNPLRTALILDAMKLGIPCMNGLPMLVAQAKKASELFTGTKIEDKKIRLITNQIENEMESIVLIGMPGCGKSSVAEVLSKKLKKPVVDTDTLILKKTGRTPKQIIEEEGEKAFRKIETSVAAEAGRLTGHIIATGGGIVTKDENYAYLRQNSRIFFINRTVKDLPTDGRPLSQNATMIQAMYEKRLPLYRSFCDFEIQAGRSVSSTANRLLKELKSLQ